MTSTVMVATSETNVVDNECTINVNFGEVPVGSVHKKSINIKNDSKASAMFR